MAFTCGFFNSQNGDRKYNAEQMASIFDGLIKDGVYDTVGDIFAVTPGTGMQVRVGSGRAWFDHTWNNNDAQYPLAIAAADVSLPRYDAVVLETNHSDTVRTNRLRVLTGTPASNPAKPTMASSANVKQHPLAYIRVTAGATAITQSMIQVVVGTSECPFVTGIIETAQIDALFQQWNGEFDEWFDNLKAQLSDNVVANLQNQINQKVNKSDVATTADIEAGTSTTKWVSPKGLKDAGLDKNEVFQVGDIRSSIRPSLGDNYALANGGILTNTSSKYVIQNLEDTSDGQTRFKYTPGSLYSTNRIYNGVGLICYLSSGSKMTGIIIKDRILYQGPVITIDSNTYRNYAYAIDDKVYVPYVSFSPITLKINIWDYKNTNQWTIVDLPTPSHLTNERGLTFASFVKYRGSIYYICSFGYPTYIYKQNNNGSWNLLNNMTNNLPYSREYGTRGTVIATDHRLLFIYYSSTSSYNYLSSAQILMIDDSLPSVSHQSSFPGAQFKSPQSTGGLPSLGPSNVSYNSSTGLVFAGLPYEGYRVGSNSYMIWTVSPSIINSIVSGGSISMSMTGLQNLQPGLGWYDNYNYLWTWCVDGNMYIGKQGRSANTNAIYKVASGPSLVQNAVNFPYVIEVNPLVNGTDIMIQGDPFTCNAANILPTVSIDGCYSYVKIK